MHTRNLILLAGLLTACSHAAQRIPAPEDLYTEEGLTVISTCFNPAEQTTSILFGNTAACTSANRGYAEHNEGEDYRLVTWRQHPNPLWFGGHINESILSIEQITTVRSGDTVKWDYRVTQGNNAGVTPEQRITHLFSLAPLAFP